LYLQPRSLYRGMSPQLVGGALETGVNYAVYQAMLRRLQAGAALVAPQNSVSCQLLLPVKGCRHVLFKWNACCCSSI
jgi:hypothetical protein